MAIICFQFKNFIILILESNNLFHVSRCQFLDEK